jgi:ATP-binding cassette, subfamily B, bacterial
MNPPLAGVTWPIEKLPDALRALASAARLPLRPPASKQTAAIVERDVEDVAARLGIEAERSSVQLGDLTRLLRGAGPVLIRLPAGTLLGVIGCRRDRLSVVGPDHGRHRLRLATLRAILLEPFEQDIVVDIERWLARVQLSPRRRAKAERALLESHSRSRRIDGIWQVRSAPGDDFFGQLRRTRVLACTGWFIATHAARHAAALLGWWLIGRGALEGRLDSGWLAAWALVIITQIPLACASSWNRAMLAIDSGALLERRLLAGALALPRERVRSFGSGQLLGRVLEAEAVQSLASSGGLASLVAVLELAFAAAVLAASVGATLHLALLAAWALFLLSSALRYHRARDGWTSARLGLTRDLVERMLGHRTRLVQQPPERRHLGEDEAVERYLASSRTADEQSAWLGALAARGWVVLGLLGLMPALALGSASPQAVAVSIGGILLAANACNKLVRGLSALSLAALAWRAASELFHAAPQLRPPRAERRERPLQPGGALLQATDLVVRFDRARPVLDGCCLEIDANSRILIEGASGSGKSTLASVLSGRRRPESGLLLLHGLDWPTLGVQGFRSAIVAVPQAHDNHVLSTSLAFNLLLGSRWPPEPEDLERARSVCEELELGPLLSRMPAGLWQAVGETGWQLSHGEKSRLYIARALLRDADLLVLDESLAALDPATFRSVLGCVLARSRALLVIAHL